MPQRSTTSLLVCASFLPHLDAWPLAGGHTVSRRDALAAAATSAASLTLPLALLPRPALAAVKAPTRSAKVLNEQLLLIMRVQEATGQETRLIKTGKFKELQRLNIKRAISFMLDNYELRDRFVTASAFAPLSQQQQATEYAQTAVEGLIQILEYFPDKLSVNDLTPEQRSFVLRALESTSKSIDEFLRLMPPEAVDGAREVLLMENRLNEEDFESEKTAGTIVNAAPAPPPPPPPPPPPQPPQEPPPPPPPDA